MNCIRCRKLIADNQTVIEMEPARFGSAHLACEIVSVKRHLFYCRFFLWLAVFSAIMTLGAVAADALTGDTCDCGCVMLMLVCPFIIPLLMRRMVIPRARRVERMAAQRLQSEQ